MGRLLTWQLSRRQSLTPFTKRVRHRGSLLKGVALHRVLYQRILDAKLTGRKKLDRKIGYCLSLNVSKTKELIMDFRKRQQRPYTPLMISGTPVERVSSFKYLGVNISEDLTWTTHIQTQVKKARQRLYHLQALRKFRVSPAILKTFYSGAIESVLTQCISGSALPSLQDIYFKSCKSRAAKILKDSTHPGNHLFCLLPSGKRFRSMMAKTERLRRSFFLLRLLNTNPVS